MSHAIGRVDYSVNPMKNVGRCQSAQTTHQRPDSPSGTVPPRDEHANE